MIKLGQGALPVPPPKKKAPYRKKKGGVRKPKIIPFSRPPPTPESVNELSSLLSGINLTSIDGEYGTFEAMGLKPKLLQGVHMYGMEKPAGVQQKAIVPCVKGRDVIVQAQSGMGKTAALAISLLERIDTSNPQCQGLVIAPTRELAEQICEVFKALGARMGITIFACMGGSNTKQCKKLLAQGRQIVVGTTGRIMHMIRKEDGQSFLNADSIKTFALDEADKMLTREFYRDVTELLNVVPTNAQIILMSATMPEHILRLTTRFMRSPLKILVNNEELTLQGIRQYYLSVDKEEFKISTLSDIYELISKARGMIFCNSRKRVDVVSNQMKASGHAVSAMRGDLHQSERDKILRDFRAGAEASRMVITSDVLARGIDVQQVNLVVNYDFPIHKEDYIHRVGRGGRYGRHGVAITFVTEKELQDLTILQEFYNTEIQPMPEVAKLANILGF